MQSEPVTVYLKDVSNILALNKGNKYAVLLTCNENRGGRGNELLNRRRQLAVLGV